MPRKIRCVTFDCYGTLIDWEKGIRKALLSLPALAGRPEIAARIAARREEFEKGLLVSATELPDEESPDEHLESPDYRPYREILAESLILAAREQQIDLTDDDARRAAGSMPSWEPFPDTKDALREIAARFPVGLLSNVEDEVIEQTMRLLGVRFDLVVTAEKVGSYKPAPDHWYAAMHEMVADEEDLFHLAASSFHDLETASLLGIPCAYVNRTGAPLLPRAKPLFSVPDLAAAAGRLRGFTPAVRRKDAPDERSGDGHPRGRSRGRPSPPRKSR